jgi:hypothetical protein
LNRQQEQAGRTFGQPILTQLPATGTLVDLRCRALRLVMAVEAFVG